MSKKNSNELPNEISHLKDKASAANDTRVIRKTYKGKVDVSDIKKNINFSDDPTVNHIACNQT